MAIETRFQATITDVSGVVGHGIPVTKEVVPERAAAKETTGRKKAKFENLIYGEPVYWATVIGSFIVVIGGLIAFLTTNNFIDTGYWISAVWDGLPKEEIWLGAGQAEPSGHWYLSYLTTGDGLQVAGLAIALLSINIGLIAAAVTLFKKKEKVFAVFAMVSAVIVALAMFVNIEG
jgi:uncharacterized membrane protein YidH (DUF202 family)